MQKIVHSEKHQFSFYVPSLLYETVSVGEYIHIGEEVLVHRIMHVIKLSVGDECVFFDREHNCLVRFIKVDKKSCIFLVQTIQKNKAIKPHITCFLPLLKKEALEEAVYNVSELGVNSIVFIKTEKSRTSLYDKELDRLQRIVVAAAEQSKEWSFPDIHKKIYTLSESIPLLKSIDHPVLCDVQGSSLLEHPFVGHEATLGIIIGPEGGLTHDEVCMMQAAGIPLYALTPTVLRALQAIAVGVSFFRLIR